MKYVLDTARYDRDTYCIGQVAAEVRYSSKAYDIWHLILVQRVFVFRMDQIIKELVVSVPFSHSLLR